MIIMYIAKPKHPGGKKEGLPQFLERILDRGVGVDLRLKAKLIDVKLIEARGILTLTSFRTAAKYNLPFPKDTNFEASGWKNLLLKEECPQCRKLIRIEDFETGCPFCGFLGE